MSLSRDALTNSIRPLFDPETMPRGPVEDAVRQWTVAYVRYATSAVAGGAVPSGLIPIGSSGRFSVALDQALRTMWMAALWAGTGLAGTTLLVPPLVPALEAVGAILIASRSPDQALSLIADALHTYTLSITVTLVPPTGTPTVAPLT